MNYKVVEFTLEYRKPEKSYFTDAKCSRELMVKWPLETPFLAHQRRLSFVVFCPKESSGTYKLAAKHITTSLGYSRPCTVHLPAEKTCKGMRKRLLQYHKEIDGFFASSRKRAVETESTFISKKPLAEVGFMAKAPAITVFREARPLLAGTLFPQNVSSSSSCDADIEITIEVNMSSVHGYERDILRLGELYSIRETSDSRPWILNINGLVGLSTKKCGAFRKNIIFRPEIFKSLSDEKLFMAVQSLVRKHFLAH